jgi:putative phosphoribosyl transferase
MSGAGLSFEKENDMYLETIERQALAEERAIGIPHQGAFLSGSFCAPAAAHAVVLIANDAGSARHLAKLRTIARQLRSQGFATLMVDLLMLEEEEEILSVAAQALRIDSARAWLLGREVGALPLVLFGMGLAAPAALISAARQPSQVTAVIACGPFPDHAGAALEHLEVPVLLIAQGDHACDLKSHRAALASLHGERDLMVLHEPREPIAAALEISLAALAFLDREGCHLRIAG